MMKTTKRGHTPAVRRRAAMAGVLGLFLAASCGAAGGAPTARAEAEAEGSADPVYFADKGVLAHSGGVYGGFTITNALAAFDHAYENGYRLFETDITLTSDNVLICTHGFNDSDYALRFIHVERPDSAPPSLEEYLTYTVGADLPVMTFSRFAGWVLAHPDVHVLLDIKECDRATARYIAEQIADEAQGTEMLSQVVMSARSTEMLLGFLDAGDFPWLHMLFAADGVRESSIYEPEDFLDFCLSHGVTSFSIEAGDYTPERAETLSGSPLKTYLYTVQDSYEAQRLLAMGADFLISDYLAPDTVAKLTEEGKLGLQAARYKSSGFTLTWLPVPEGASVELQRTDMTSGETVAIPVRDPALCKYQDTDVSSGVPYAYVLSVRLEDGTLLRSIPEYAKLIGTTRFTSAQRVDGGIRLTWDAVPGADGCLIRRTVGEDGEKIIWATVDDPAQTEWFDPSEPPADEPVYYDLRLYSLYNGVRYYGGYGKVIEVK